MTIAANLKRVREQLGQSPVTLVAVSKYVGIAEVIEAYENGVTEFGESRIQDAIKKQDEMPPQVAEHIRWHFIGHLQSNKARKALGRFSLIHSVDSLELVQELSQQAAKKNLIQAILLQVKVLDDPNKSGFSPEALKECFQQIYKLPGLKIEGLMTMTPLTDDPSIWKECFTGLKDLKTELEERHGVRLKELSMGMSDDYIDAVKYGATIVRVGRAIFEKSEN
jgi:pyridoxal phosphate enzyme (YggS family)